MQARDWMLKRNCSITPRQLGWAYLAICVASGIVALGFTLQGAWYVLAFAVMELSAVGAAFVVFGRHATDRERIALSGDALLVEVVEAERVRRIDLDARRVSVDVPAQNALVRIRCAGRTVEVGRFVPDAKRRQFARELSLALRQTGPAAEV